MHRHEPAFPELVAFGVPQVGQFTVYEMLGGPVFPVPKQKLQTRNILTEFADVHVLPVPGRVMPEPLAGQAIDDHAKAVSYLHPTVFVDIRSGRDIDVIVFPGTRESRHWVTPQQRSIVVEEARTHGHFVAAIAVHIADGRLVTGREIIPAI